MLGVCQGLRFDTCRQLSYKKLEWGELPNFVGCGFGQVNRVGESAHVS